MTQPYREIERTVVSSTQDVAREHFDGSRLVVITDGQTQGRGRIGRVWENSPQAVAVTAAYHSDWEVDQRSVVPLIAGLAAAETIGVGLKWPNDLLAGSKKVGGILVESSHNLVLVGMGLNLWWPDPTQGAGALFEDPPEAGVGRDIVRRWATRFFETVDLGFEAWPKDRYRIRCVTLGRRIGWREDGKQRFGTANGLGSDGSLIVETADGQRLLHAGEVSHIRPNTEVGGVAPIGLADDLDGRLREGGQKEV